MLKEELKKINNEYKYLINLKFVMYFHFNKLKAAIKIIFSILLLFFSWIFLYSYKVIEIPNLIKNDYSPILVYSAFMFISFIIIFSLIATCYINVYSFFQWIKNKEKLNFNSYKEYSEYVNDLKNKALNIYCEIKNIDTKP